MFQGKKFIQKFITGLIFITIFNIGSLSFAFASATSSNIVTLVNSTRQSSGLNTLNTNSKLESAAFAKANDMLAKGYFAHVSPDGKQPWDFISTTGYNYVYAGENLAIGYNNNQEVMTAWMNSSSHRENILNPNYQEIGMATVNGKYQGTETTVIVQEFGSLTEKTSQVAGTVNNQNFQIDTSKSNFSPNKIFAGSEVIFNAVVTGDVSDIYIIVGYQKIVFNAPTQDGVNKIYTIKANIEKAGDYDVTLTVTDKWGNKETKTLGQLTVAEKVIAKASIVKNNGFVENNLGYIVIAGAVLALGVGGYIVFHYQKKQHKFA